jgi:DNA-binding response OmpR family regulator
VDALADGTAEDVCRVAAAAPSAPSVVITEPDLTRVPYLLAAGCDDIVLRPVDSQLLCNRVRRVLRLRRTRSSGGHRMSGTARSGGPAGSRRTYGTNGYLATHECPRCGTAGIYRFDNASHRRAWYSCTECKNVWLTVRHDN